MSNSDFRWCLLLFAAVAGAAGARAAVAKDCFLTIGGGYGPTGNQISLERNVVFLQTILAEKRPDGPQHDVYFADGDDESRDVQFRDPKFAETCPPARRMMAELFGDADEIDLKFRDNEVANLRGPAELSGIRRRMKEIARELSAGDRLIIYVTGHGGPASDPNEYRHSWSDEDSPEYNRYNTSFSVWNHESISASDFAGWLDRLPQEVGVVMVMVQCFAGGFAHTIFHEADAELGLAPHRRCGFFAQMHDRGASGCTPDINEADYQEYSSHFWAALGGRTRVGQLVDSADYNGDGQVTFLEAHAYALLESDTIDVPVTTSGALLRQYSRIGNERKPSDAEEETADNPLERLLGALASPSAKGQRVMELKGPLAKLIELARPDQRIILERLPPALDLGARPTVEDVRRKLEQLEEKGSAAGARYLTVVGAYDRSRERALEDVREMWPELHFNFSPVAMELTSERADEFVAGVGRITAYQAMCRARERQRTVGDEYNKLRCGEAKLQRLLRTCEDVVLAANLPLAAPDEIVARYEQMLELEGGTLSSAAANVAKPGKEEQ